VDATVSLIGDTAAWLADPEHWSGPDGVPARLAEHLTVSGLAVLLAAVGLYGLLSYGVAQRSHEIGVRMALGATESGVVRLVLRGSMVLVGAGTIIGIAGSLAVTRVLGSLLFEVRPTDPAAFAAAAAVLVTVAALASYIPARRATRVDPLVALRAD